MGRITGGEHYGENWLDWAPSWSCGGSMTFGGGSPTVNYARYKYVPGGIEVYVRAYGTTAGNSNNSIYCTNPTGIFAKNTWQPLAGQCRDASSGAVRSGMAATTTVTNPGDAIIFRKRDGSNFALGANRYVGVAGFIET